MLLLFLAQRLRNQDHDNIRFRNEVRRVIKKSEKLDNHIIRNMIHLTRNIHNLILKETSIVFLHLAILLYHAQKTYANPSRNIMFNALVSESEFFSCLLAHST